MQRRTFWQWLADKANVRVHLERDAILGWIEHGRIAERSEWEKRLRFVPPPETPVRTNTPSTLNPPPSLAELAASNEAHRQRNQAASAEIRTQHSLPRFDLTARQAAFREQMKQRKQEGQA